MSFVPHYLFIEVCDCPHPSFQIVLWVSNFKVVSHGTGVENLRKEVVAVEEQEKRGVLRGALSSQ